MISRTSKTVAAAGAILALGVSGVALAAPGRSGTATPASTQAAKAMMSGDHVRAMQRAGMTKADAEAMVRRCREMMKDHQSMMGGSGGAMMRGGSSMMGGNGSSGSSRMSGSMMQ